MGLGSARLAARGRRRVAIFAAAICVVALTSSVGTGATGRAKQSSSEKIVPGEVIVSFRAGTAPAARAAARAGIAAQFSRSLLMPRTEVVNVAKGTEAAAAARLAHNPNVVFAEPNRILHALATPSDTRFLDLWGLNNTGQAVNGVAGLADADIDAVEAWNIGKGLGSGVRVADIDTGVAMNHPELAANIFTNPGESGGGKETNGIDDDANGKIDDVHGWDFINNDNNPTDDNAHGSHVAGTIAARANNSAGVAGVASFPTVTGLGAWNNPKIVPIKVLAANGSGSITAIANGITYAGVIGAKVANMSLGGAGTSPTLDAAISGKPNTLYLVAAGNDGVNNDTSPHTPCVPASTPDAPNKICVAATDSHDALASFSNFGVANVDLAAPGVTILSTVPTTTVFQDNLEGGLGKWVTNDAGQTPPVSPRWGLTTLFASSATHSITDSPGGTPASPTPYAANQSNWARNATGIDLSGGSNCRVDAQARIDTEDGFDFLRVEATRTPATPASWQGIFSFSGQGEGTIEANLPAAFNGLPGTFIRFRLTSDNTVQRDGAYIDDVSVVCFKSTFDATSFAFFNGTSMATPHVTGAAAFLATKFPTATVAQLKDKLLRSVDHKAALTGKVATGGRLNLYKAAAESSAAVKTGILTFAAGAGQTNNIVVSRFTDTDGIAKYRITDNYSTSTMAIQSGSRIRPGVGCASINDTAVKCPIAGITRIVVNSGDMNDGLNAATILIPVTLNGSTGNDVLTGGTAGDTLTGGTGIDRFTAGTGNDVINARNDDVDSLFNCGENASDNDTVNADLVPNDPITASPANCEVVNKL